MQKTWNISTGDFSRKEPQNMEKVQDLQEMQEDATQEPRGGLSGLENIRLPEEWVNKVMADYDATQRARRAPQKGSRTAPEPLPEGFIETAAGILIHSLLKADKEKDIAAAVEGFLTAAEDITPQRARELYREHYT
jgi:hypothetical protein